MSLRVRFWALCSSLWVFMSVCVLLLHYFDYRSFLMQFDTSRYSVSNFNSDFSKSLWLFGNLGLKTFFFCRKCHGIEIRIALYL